MQLSQIKLFRLILIILLFFILSVQSGSAEEIDVLDFLPAILAGRASCDIDPAREILIPPYSNESDMQEIRGSFSTVVSGSPQNMVHDGLDIYPVEDLKPFQAACSGRIERIYTFDDQVTVMLACDSTYLLQYNFESQSPGTGQTQLENMTVEEGQTVSQGDIIGYLYVANAERAHVHFTFLKNWVPRCPEPYFSQEARNSVLNLIHKVHPGARMCYGCNANPTPLVTPYVNESDMVQIKAGYSSENSSPPWGSAHDGLDIYPDGDLKPFQAACSGKVISVMSEQAGTESNWQVEVLVGCNDYVYDPDKGNYFIPSAVSYVFETMSDVQADGQTQLANISVAKGQTVSQGNIIGYLHAVNGNSHVHFGVSPYGAISYSMGIPLLKVCPEPFFATNPKNSILDLLHIAWPSADICYQN